MISLGIIGLGGIAAGLHLPEIRSLPGLFSVAGAADPSPAAAARAAELELPSLTADYRELLADPSIDAVVITSPHDCHVTHCVDALRAGKHVLVEKPIARTLEEAQTILQAAKAADRLLMVGFNERYTPIHSRIKRLLEEGGLGGKILTARIDHFQNFNPTPGSWWRSRESVGGGCVIGSGIHRLDLLRWYLGEPTEVYAQAVYVPSRLEAEACVNAVIRFQSGATADFVCNWAVDRYPYYESLSLCGSDGIVVTDGSRLQGCHKDIGCGALHDIPAEEPEGMYRHFARCIATGESPLTSGEEGYKSLRLALAVTESADKGLPVRL